MLSHVVTQLVKLQLRVSLPERCPYLEFFWSVFSDIRAEYGEIFGPNAKKYGPEKLRIRTLLTHCLALVVVMDSRYKTKDELLMLTILDAEKFLFRGLSRKAKYDHFDY